VVPVALEQVVDHQVDDLARGQIDTHVVTQVRGPLP